MSVISTSIIIVVNSLSHQVSPPAATAVVRVAPPAALLFCRYSASGRARTMN